MSIVTLASKPNDARIVKERPRFIWRCLYELPFVAGKWFHKALSRLRDVAAKLEALRITVPIHLASRACAQHVQKMKGSPM